MGNVPFLVTGIVENGSVKHNIWALFAGNVKSSCISFHISRKMVYYIETF